MSLSLACRARSFYTLFIAQTIRFLRIWMQSLVPPVITSALYFMIFGHLIGPRIGQVSGWNYMQYIAPGLVMMTVINASYGNATFGLYMARFQHSVEEILVSPMSHFSILMGYVLPSVMRGLIVGLLVVGVSLYFTHFYVHYGLLTFSVAVIAALLFSLLGLINAMFARNFDDVAIIPTFVLTPLTYFGGVFYSMDMLPPFWQKLSYANPILYIVNTFRYGLLGISDVNVWISFVILIGCVLFLLGVCLWLLKRGVGLRN